MQVIVSCTTIFDRQRQTARMLTSLLTQSRVPDKIHLYVSKKPYLLDKGIQPYCLDPLLYAITEKDKRIQVEWVENTGPYRKLLPALQKYWQQDLVLITCDDDVEYNANFIEKAVSFYEEKQCSIGFQGTLMNPTLDYKTFQDAKGTQDLWNLAKGVGGVVYNPKWFTNKAILTVDPRWKNDDLWFVAWRIASGIECYIAEEGSVRNSLATKANLWNSFNEQNNSSFLEEIFLLFLYQGWFSKPLREFFSKDIQLLCQWNDFIQSKLLPLVDEEGLEGNIWSLNNTKLPSVQMFNKQKNILWLATQVEGDMIEIGFNAGFSSLLLLLANPSLHILAFDLGEHAYAKKCYEVLRETFGDRISIVFGDSRETLPKVEKQSVSFLHLDGGHSEEVARSDVQVSVKLLKPNGYLLVDDTNLGDVQKAIASVNCLKEEQLPFKLTNYKHSLYRLVEVP